MSMGQNRNLWRLGATPLQRAAAWLDAARYWRRLDRPYARLCLSEARRLRA